MKSVTQSCSISLHSIIFKFHWWSHSSFGYVKMLTVIFWFYYIFSPNSSLAKSLCVSSSDTWTHSNRSDTAHLGSIVYLPKRVSHIYTLILLCAVWTFHRVIWLLYSIVLWETKVVAWLNEQLIITKERELKSINIERYYTWS